MRRPLWLIIAELLDVGWILGALIAFRPSAAVHHHAQHPLKCAGFQPLQMWRSPGNLLYQVPLT